MAPATGAIECRCLLCLFCTFVYSLCPLFCFLSFRCDGEKLHTGLNIIKAAVRTFICNWGLSLSIRNTLSFPISAPGPSLPSSLPLFLPSSLSPTHRILPLVGTLNIYGGDSHLHTGCHSPLFPHLDTQMLTFLAVLIFSNFYFSPCLL